MIITKILMSLPENLKHFVSAWESTASENQTLENLTSRLMLEEERYKHTEKVMALSSSSNNTKEHSNVRCFRCNKVGHVKKNCSQLKSKEKRVCHFCTKRGHLMKDCWFKKNKEGSNNCETDINQALVDVSSVLSCTGSNNVNN